MVRVVLAAAILQASSFLSALASAAQAESSAVSSCSSGLCLAEELSNTVSEADDVLDPAVGLMQKALLYKKREQRLGEIARVNASQPAQVITDEKPFRAHFSPCLLESDGYRSIPFSTAGVAQVEFFQAMGLVRPQQICTSQTPSLSSFMPGYDAEKQNDIAQWVIMIWAGIAGILIIWSIGSVIFVPRKKELEGITAQKMNLADEDKAWKQGFFHWVSLSWVDDLVGRYGKCLHSVIDDKEIISNRQDEEYKPYVVFRDHWRAEIEAKGSVANASLVNALYKTVGFRATVSLVIMVIIEEIFSSLAMVWALEKFLNTLEEINVQKRLNPGQPVSLLEPTLQVVGLLWGVPMVYRTASIVVNLLDGHYTNICAAGLASTVFEKAMNLPVGSAALQEPEVAQSGDEDTKESNQKQPSVVQLLNVDIIEVWGYLLRDTLYTIMSPFIMVVLFIMMIKEIKMAGVVGFAYVVPCVIMIVLAQWWNVSWWKRYQIFQDQRLKWLTETILHIRTIKSLAWEKLSYEKLHNAREAELMCNQRCSIVGGFIASIAHTLPWGSLLLALYFMMMTEGGVEAHKIIIIQRIIGALLASLGQLIVGLHKMVAVPNSFRRIKTFLAQADRPNPNLIRQPVLGNPNAPIVRLRGSFSYVKDQPPILQDLDVAIPRGELVGVVGAVGSGKSSFMQAIIGELYPVGNAFIEAPMPGTGRVAYCAQVPWIFEGTLRENIIMNDALEHDRYYKSLYAAGLTHDLQILPGGDQVTIGSYGIRLSGGQRARVALARAAYMEQADVVVIDDPFAAVDAQTGQHICNELLLGPVMRGRTRIVVTQPNPSRLRSFDRILVLENGRVVETGPPAEVMETKAFKRLLCESKDGSATAEEAGHEVRSSGGQGNVSAMIKKAVEPANQLRDAEAHDYISWSTMVWWFQAAGLTNIFVFLGMVTVQRSVELRESLVLAVWIDTKMAQPLVDDRVFILRCIMVVSAACVSIVLAQYACSRVSISASRKIHEGVMKSILRAPVDRFFDKQPIGRLINRLSLDMRQVDDAVTMVIFAMLAFAVGFVVTNSFILRAVPTKIAICSIPFFLVIGYFTYLYRGIAVPLVFHSKFSLSNLQDLQTVVLHSCVSIRANGMFDGFMIRYNHYSQSVIRSQYLIFHVCKAWVQSRVFLCFSALTCVFALGGLWSDMPMGTLATIITMSFTQMHEFEHISMGFTQFLNVLNALQRLTRYMHIPQEAAGELPSDPLVRLRAKLERLELASLELKRGPAVKEYLSTAHPARSHESEPSLLVCIRGKSPVLRASPDGTALELVEGCKLRDLAPGCKAFKHIEDGYLIIAVNSVSNSAELMAQELCNPPSSLWLDLWNSKFSEGMRVQLEDLSAGYGNEKSVLHGINLTIEPRMKCGFVGKTGCGKSTTLLCILRLLEPRSGRILVGGRDTSKLGLATLRSMVGLVPQDPTVFEGSWRFNIDPFGEFPDGRIWEALQCVQLMPFLRSLPDGIDSEISRDGANLSFGQRQLLSLARMVVRQPPVLLLDECTSALDPVTQEAAQKTLISGFPMTTVIAIAHRVETIMNFDRIIVFDEGSIAEQGSVEEVLKVENGIFANMVKHYEQLRAVKLHILLLNTEITVAANTGSEALLAVVASRTSEFNVINAATALHRFGRIHGRDNFEKGPLAEDKAFGALLRRAVELLNSARSSDARAVATIAHSLGSLGIRDSDTAKAVVAAAGKHLEHFDRQGLANLAWALARLPKVKGTGPLARKVALAARAEVWNFGPQ
ncbi:unnamed protein product, partial [Polarella glacialis]